MRLRWRAVLFVFTNGRNVGTSASPSPTAGLAWKHLFHPVNSAIHAVRPLPVEPSFTTVMNWQVP